MKLRKLLLPFFLSLGLASCDISLKSVTGVSVEIEQKSRVEGDSFLTSEFNVIVEYSNNTTKKVSFSDFGEYLLSASYYSPISEKSKRLDGDFVLEEVGTYTIEVSYNPTSKYQYKSSGNAYFVVEKKIVPATSMTLSSDSLSLCKGESGLITYSILPEDSTTKTPTFVTNDNNIATVDEEGNVLTTVTGELGVNLKTDGIISIEEECHNEFTKIYTQDADKNIPINVYNSNLMDGFLRGIIDPLLEKGVDFLWQDDDNAQNRRYTKSILHS
mgnify:CR=1 FL=1